MFRSVSNTLTRAAREVLDSVLDALRYLHAQGLVLGALDPDHIVAVGDGIELSTDALRDADTSSAYRKNVRLLGDLLARKHRSNKRIPCIPDCQYYGMLVSSSVRQSWCPGENASTGLRHPSRSCGTVRHAQNDPVVLIT